MNNRQTLASDHMANCTCTLCLMKFVNNANNSVSIFKQIGCRLPVLF